MAAFCSFQIGPFPGPFLLLREDFADPEQEIKEAQPPFQLQHLITKAPQRWWIRMMEVGCFISEISEAVIVGLDLISISPNWNGLLYLLCLLTAWKILLSVWQIAGN